MKIAFNTFTGGEISPKLAGRGDVTGTKCALRLRNYFPRITGGIFRRPGLLYSWSAKTDDYEPKLLPFNFSSDDSLLLELSQNLLRVGQNDALIGSPFELATPWEADELQSLRYRQINDVVFLAHPDHPPYRLTRIANDNWTLESLHDIIAEQDPENGFPWPAFMDENPGVKTLTVTGDISNLGGLVSISASGDVFDPAHVGAFFQVAHRRDNAFDQIYIPVYPAASATMDFRVQPIDGQQYTINGSVYTWRDSANVSGAYQIIIGADTEESRDHTVYGINGDTTNGGFGPGTAPNPDVEAFKEELSATNQSAQGILTGDGTNRLAFPNLPGAVNVVVRIGSVYYGFLQNPVDTLFNGATYNVKMGATEKASLQNLVKAINASGVNGTDYYGPSGVTAHPDVTASLTADNQITITAKTAGVAGNSVVTAVNNTSASPEPLNWGASTLTGGGGSTSFRLRVESREVGTAGNSITVGGMYRAVASSSDAGVTNVSNNDTVTIGTKAYTFKTVLTPTANEVLIAADWDASMLNLSRAVNLTGTPGTDYALATTINADAFAATTITADHKLIFISKVNNPASSIASTETAATISFLSTVFQSPWNSATLTGGADVDINSDGFEVLGDYKIFSYGLWKGTVILERENPDGTWEALRQWSGNNDRNIAETGTAEYPQKLRFRVVDGTGTASADVDRPRFVIEADDARIYGVVRISTVISATEATGTIVRPVYSTEATRNWSEGAWSDYRGYPAALTLHNQRLIFMGTANQPLTLWGSATADFMNFRRGLNDSDGFSFSLAADESSPIVWGQSVGAGIIVGTESSEWLATASDGSASMTPTNFQAKRQSQYGSANVEAIIVGPRALFAKSGARYVMEFQYAYDEQAFFALALNELSDHLTLAGIKQLAFSRKPEEMVWVVTNDGKLLTMTYRREKQEIAWAYHEMADTECESIAVINGTELVDHVYIATKRTLNGSDRRFVERIDLDTLINLDSDEIDTEAQRSLLTYLDCSKRSTGTFTDSADGFDHLEGLEVALWVDGTRHNPKVVTGGEVELDRPASTVLAGLDYSDETMFASYHTDLSQSPGTTQGKRYKAGEILARVYRTTAFRVADDLTTDKIFDAKILQVTDPVNTIHPAVSRIVRCCGAPMWQDDITLTIRATGAEPSNILAIIADMEISRD